MKKIPEKYQNIAKVIIGVSLLGWLISKVDMGKVITLFSKGAIHQLLTGIAILLIAFSGFQALRFHWCIKSISENIKTSTRLFYLGFLFNNMLPGNFGGDAIRMMYLQKMQGKSFGEPAGLLIIYRFTGLLILLLGGLLHFITHYAFLTDAFSSMVEVNFLPGLKTGGILAIIGAILLLTLLHPKIRKKLFETIREASQTYRLFRGRDFAGIIALAIAFHLGRMAGFYYLVSFFGDSVHFEHLIFVLFFTMVISLIPISFGALGLMEGAITSSLLLFDVSTAAATGVALVNRAILLIIAGIGGVIYLLHSATSLAKTY